MYYIHRLPFILSIFMSVVAGILSSAYRLTSQVIYARMAISMVVFFILGLYIKKIIEQIESQMIEKKEKEEKEEKEKLEQEAAANNINAPTIDYRVEGDGEDFLPLKVSDYINKDAKKH